MAVGTGNVLGALELQHYDGPWVSADDQRKLNAVLRYSNGDEHDGASLTGMFYHGVWNSTTDQPDRAISAWFRTAVGIREDYIHGVDSGTNSGTARQSLFQPKISLIFTPAATTELYLSAGRGLHSDDLRAVTQTAVTGQSGVPLIAKQKGEELGLRQELLQGKVTVTLALFNLDAESETTYDPHAGEDGAGPGSRRRGYEINLTYQALKWLEFDASYSGDHARFTTDFDDGTGHVGRYLPNAPFATGSFNVYVNGTPAWVCTTS